MNDSNDSTERFFREIADRVGYDRVTELHLFPAIRQGGMESAVAVVAAHPEAEPEDGGIERHVVYTARYRLTRKGPDRGKWEIEVKAEADAPLVTVDEVVRGVRHRSGDEGEPERIAGDQFRAIVPPPVAPELAPVSPAPSDTPPPDSASE
jgi:hypothetical protein